MAWILAGLAVAALVAGFGFALWKVRQRNRTRLISFVALVKEPVEIDPAVVARVAGEAWNVDLGDGTAEGPDGFVAGVGPMTTILHGQRMFLINSFPQPYSDTVEQDAEGIPDLRIRRLFLEHQAWFSCDAMGVDGTTDEETVKDWYRRLARLFVELLDDRCLMIFLPDANLGFPINDDTEEALRSDDPIQALQDTLSLPVVEVAEGDPLMVQAVQTAQERWPEFVKNFEASAGENFSIKAPITRDDNTEFIWISVTSIEGERIYGKLGNDPANLGPLKLGSKVSVPLADLNDWCYMDVKGELVGGFTIAAIAKAAKQRRKPKSS